LKPTCVHLHVEKCKKVGEKVIKNTCGTIKALHIVRETIHQTAVGTVSCKKACTIPVKPCAPVCQK